MNRASRYGGGKKMRCPAAGKTYFRSLMANKLNYVDKATTTPEHYNSTNAVSGDCCLATASEPPPESPEPGTA
jgi:hypothetical protein